MKIFEPVTLSLVPNRNGEFLFGEKVKRVGKGRLNAPGGKVEAGETIAQATVRELEQEAGLHISPRYVLPRAVLDCHTYEDGGVRAMRMFVSLIDTDQWGGRLASSKEMRNYSWITPEDIPYERLLPGDRLWLPKVLSRKCVRGEIRYASGEKKLRQPSFVIKIDTETLNRLWKLP